MTLQIYNTLTRKKESFDPLHEGEVRMYVCGPTVYAKAHVGHAMSSVVFDVVRRYLEYKGYRVFHVMNYTDVDDKVIDRANELKEDPLKLAERYIREYRQHMLELNVLPASAYPRVSQEIEAIQTMVEGLIESGYAYEVEGDVYFRVSRDEDYGKLSGRRLEDMRAGSRVDVDERKEDPADFALWKSAKPGEPFWESPWGPGRPGWHIECSAMSLAHLGERIDIHGGGSDLVFPHHENEIAQSESFTGKPFARYWMHNGMLQFTGEKMSKSVGNVVTVEAFLEQHPPDVLRMIVLNANYRSPLTFNEDVIEQATRGLERLRGGLRPARPSGEADEAVRIKLQERAEEARKAFDAAMDDDFNTPGALSQLFELVRAINQARDEGVGEDDLSAAQSVLIELAAVLGLRLEAADNASQPVAPFIELLLEVREDLRAAKQFELADRIRDGLQERGIQIEDSPDGTIWRVKPQ
ncbi:MAG: cysteine--tRNA ligase [Anaerolineales bacterium]|nr:cysteine--tRNA ligase [Anaerolineales bacterium]